MSQTLKSLQRIFLHFIPDYYNGTLDFPPNPKSRLLSLPEAMSEISLGPGAFLGFQLMRRPYFSVQCLVSFLVMHGTLRLSLQLLSIPLFLSDATEMITFTLLGVPQSLPPQSLNTERRIPLTGHFTLLCHRPQF